MTAEEISNDRQTKTITAELEGGFGVRSLTKAKIAPTTSGKKAMYPTTPV
jgi:hypothetical protein